MKSFCRETTANIVEIYLRIGTKFDWKQPVNIQLLNIWNEKAELDHCKDCITLTPEGVSWPAVLILTSCFIRNPKT